MSCANGSILYDLLFCKHVTSGGRYSSKIKVQVPRAGRADVIHREFSSRNVLQLDTALPRELWSSITGCHMFGKQQIVVFERCLLFCCGTVTDRHHLLFCKHMTSGGRCSS